MRRKTPEPLNRGASPLIDRQIVLVFYMASESDLILNRDGRFRPGAAMGAGLVGAVLLWLFSHGTPWFTSGMISPTLMGRDLKAPGLVDPAGSTITVLALLIVSLGYAFIVAGSVTRLRGVWALVAGALIGGVLYCLNFAVFHFLRGVDWVSATELPVIVTHVVFCAVVAGLYKGIAARRVAV